MIAFRFQMERSSKPLPRGSDSEEEEGSEAEDIDGPERKMSVSADSRSSQCKKQ